jgi:DNA-binding MarR family transcriptional regulator
VETDEHLADDDMASGHAHGPAADDGDGDDGVDRIVGQWAHERPDLDTTPMAVFGRIFRLSRLAGDRMEQAYAEFGIGRPEFDVLATLRRAGEPFQLSPGELAASMMLSTGGTTARLDRLEKAGLVRRLPSPTDRRSVLVKLTEAGFDVIERAVEAGLAEQQRMLARLPADKLRQLDDLLREALLATGGARATADYRWLSPGRPADPVDPRGARRRGRGRS